MSKDYDINKLAAEILLKGEEDSGLKQMRESAGKQVGGHLKEIIADVLNKRTSLKGDKIGSICDQVIERYLEDVT